MTKLHKFEGSEVIGTKIKLTNAGDGLSQAMAIEPMELRSRSTVYLVMEAEVGDITFKPVKDTDAMVRIQQLKAGTATIVEAELVASVLAEQKAKNIAAAEEAAGVVRLDFGDAVEEAADNGN